MPGHYFLPPSGAGSWVHCAYWPTANRDNPQEPTPESIEGNVAHEVVALALRGSPVAFGASVPGYDTFILDEEMQEATSTYIEDVIKHSRGQPLYVEQPLVAPSIHESLCGGTPDCFAWVSQNHLVIWDFKYGHNFVAAFSNWQLMTYARAILDTWDVDGGRELEITVEMRLIQPRNYDREGPIRSWAIKAAELRAFWNILQGKAYEATQPNPRATAGTHCKHCPGRHTCPAAQRAAYAATVYATDGTPFALNGDALGRELRVLEDAREVLDARITGLQQEARAKIAKREPVTGYTLERGEGRKRWKVPHEKVLELGRMFGADLEKRQTLTPLQAAKAGIPQEVIAGYASNPVAEPKLIRNENSHARKIFGHKP